MTLVDIGAGTGAFAAAFSDWSDLSVLGVEPSAAMRNQIPRTPAIQVLEGNASTLPLPGESAAAAWLSLIIHHIPDLVPRQAPFARSGPARAVSGLTSAAARIPGPLAGDAAPGRPPGATRGYPRPRAPHRPASGALTAPPEPAGNPTCRGWFCADRFMRNLTENEFRRGTDVTKKVFIAGRDGP